MKLTSKLNGNKDLEELKVPDRDASPYEWQLVFNYVRGTTLASDFYEKYLRSIAWSNKRVEVFEEKGLRCVVGYEGCNILADHIHHKSYERVGNERIEDLEPVCSHCHQKIHS